MIIIYMEIENCEQDNNIDFTAKSIFLFLIFLSVLNDSFNFYNDIIENEFVKDKLIYFKDLKKAFIGIISNKEKKTKKGIIIKDTEKNNDTDKCSKSSNNNKKFKNTLMDEITEK